MNFFEGALAERNGALVFQERAGKEPGFCAVLPKADGLREQAGRTVTLGLRPEHIVTAAEGDGTGVVRALLERVEPGGAESLLYCTNGNHSFVARERGGGALRAGETVALRFDMDHARFFVPVTGAAVGG
jgi:multiple sugar transport system ATP-binding protein